MVLKIKPEKLFGRDNPKNLQVHEHDVLHYWSLSSFLCWLCWEFLHVQESHKSLALCRRLRYQPCHQKLSCDAGNIHALRATNRATIGNWDQQKINEKMKKKEIQAAKYYREGSLKL